MTDITKLDLDNSQPKFVSVGNNVFVSSNGKSEVCRKGQQGLFCRRHHGSSYSSQPEVRALLDKHANRTIEKLSPFENGCIWLYSVLMRTTIEEARNRYIESTAMYTMLGIRKPTDIEVKGLQKVLMGLIESSRIQDTRMDKLKKLVKNMAFGQGFTEAGFYTLKDMTKETINKIKMGFAGLALGATMTLTGCAGVQNPNPTSEQVQVIEKPSIKSETVTDEFGSYQRDSSASVQLTWDRNDATGLPDAEDAELKSWIGNFIMTEALDSIALDNHSAWDSWASKVAPKYLHSKYINELLTSESPIILAERADSKTEKIEDLFPLLFRDGGKRVSEKTILESGIIVDSDNSSLFYVNVSGYMTTKAEDKNYLDWELTNMALYQDVPQSYIDASASNPQFNDNKPEDIRVDFTINYTVTKENGKWKIAGFDNKFSIYPNSN